MTAPTPGGTTVGPYRLERLLGSGGMGVVYLGYDQTTGAAAAVKLIRPEHAADPGFLARLRREVAAARRVPRFCTAPVLAADLDADPPWLATEYIDGPSLDVVVLEQGPLTGGDLDAFAAGVAVALRAIHQQGVVHRDLKPSNILLSPMGPRVIDFGIAQIDDPGGEVTTAGAAVGTIAYMAPEQLAGAPPSPAVDVFAWAGLVRYAATGQPPFGSGHSAPYAIMYEQPDLGGLAEPLRGLVAAAFHKDPRRRPSAAEVVDRLSRTASAAKVIATAAAPSEPPPAPPALHPAPEPPRPRWRVLAAAALAATAVAVAGAVAIGWPAGDGRTPEGVDRSPTPPGGADRLPRDETLYLSGGGPGSTENWNPIGPGAAAPGVRGLLYETLFLFDPRTAELEPWLAERGEWVAADEYVVTLRDGIRWSDGEPVTAADVVFTVNLGRIPEIPYSTVFDYLDTAEAGDDRTVRFTFSEARRGEWEIFLSSRQIVPEHTWGELPADEIPAASGARIRVGTGPYLYHSHTDDRVVWERHEDWWGGAQLGLEPQPRYVVDTRSTDPAETLARLAGGELDLSNDFLPGVHERSEFGETVTTFYDEPPYMLPEGTVYLVPNHDRAPLDDGAFRRALGYGIDVDTIVETIYGGLAARADPTGLLPVWLDRHTVDDGTVARYGFRYAPERARTLLADAGYADRNGDGFVQLPDGGRFGLELAVPEWVPDWVQAAEVVVDDLRDIGIDATLRPVERNPGGVVTIGGPDPYLQLRIDGEFDLTFESLTDLDRTPWLTYRYLFRPGNFHRYRHEPAWGLTQELGRLAATDQDVPGLVAELQQVALTELPAIPLWHGSLWSQVSGAVWTNWPSADPDTPDHYPSLRDGGWEKGAIYLLAELEPAA